MKVVIGSGNPGKLAELSDTLRAAGFEPVSGADFAAEAAETGATPAKMPRSRPKLTPKPPGCRPSRWIRGCFLRSCP